MTFCIEAATLAAGPSAHLLQVGELVVPSITGPDAILPYKYKFGLVERGLQIVQGR